MKSKIDLVKSRGHCYERRLFSWFGFKIKGISCSHIWEFAGNGLMFLWIGIFPESNLEIHRIKNFMCNPSSASQQHHPVTPIGLVGRVQYSAHKAPQKAVGTANQLHPRLQYMIKCSR
jgi:hypothetical protein